MTSSVERSDRRRAVVEYAIALAAIAAATALFSAPIYAGSDRMPAGHDHALAIGLAEGVAQGLAEGHLYPRWVRDANSGFGLPALVGYPPLGAYVVGVLSLITDDMMSAFRGAILIFNFLSGLAFFLLARRFSRPSIAGLGAALYILMPYHFVVVYHRFAFAEFSATVWLPLVLHFGLQLRAKASLGAALGLAASFAAVVLSHVVVAQMIVVTVGVLVLFGSRPWRHPSRGATMAAALAAAALLAAAYVIPVLLSRDYTHWDAQYRAGRSIPFIFAVRGDEFSTRLELSFLVMCACVAPGLPALWRRRQPALQITIAAALAAIAMHLFVSQPVWDHLPGMQYLLYPFRFGLVLCLFAPIALVWAFGRQPVLAGLAGLACLGAVATAPEMVTGVRWVDLHETDIIHWNQEHIPRAVASIRRRPPMRNHYQLVGAGSAQVLAWAPHRRRIRVTVTAPNARLRVGTWYYPGWTATVDGRARPLGPEPRSGLLVVSLDEGEHDVTLEFVDTNDRRAGKIVSAVAILTWLILLGWTVRRRRTERA